MARTPPDFSFETAAHARALAPVAGVDEVGRGPLAGPVTAAAVILDQARIPQGLLYAEIMCSAQVSVAHATVEEIDALNILRASHLAMERAVAGLGTPPAHVLVDGNLIPAGLQGRAEAIVKGDAKSLSIAAASIIAKVTRDRIMVDLAQQHPGYGWEINAGYPTKQHLEALLNLGVTPWHRRSFRPVHNILYQEVSVSY
jgi:ribonuclease HII